MGFILEEEAGMSEREVRYRWDMYYEAWIVQCNGKSEAFCATERGAKRLAKKYKKGKELPSEKRARKGEWKYV